jgi:nucleoside-diphosphate-sugar epimerase
MRIDFSPLEGKRVLVDGYSGFIGTWMMKLLSESRAHCDLRYFNGRHETFNQDENLRWMNTVIKPVDYMIHLAPVGPEIPLWAEARINTLFTSSGAVHDEIRNDYAETKVRTERALIDSGMPLSIARIYSTCGEGMHRNHAFATMAQQAIKGEKLTVWGSGEVVRSYQYVEDTAVWLWNILLHGSGIYDVGSTYTLTLNQLAKEISSHFTPRPRIEHIKPTFIDPHPIYVPDTSRAVWELGVTNVVSLSDSIDKTIDWMKNDK